MFRRGSFSARSFNPRSWHFQPVVADQAAQVYGSGGKARGRRDDDEEALHALVREHWDAIDDLRSRPLPGSGAGTSIEPARADPDQVVPVPAGGYQPVEAARPAVDVEILRLPPAVAAQLADGLDLDEDDAEALVMILAALH